MCADSVATYILNDTVIQSLRDGRSAIYWTPNTTWDLLRGARAVDIDWRLLSALGSPVVKIFLQRSVDGSSWTTCLSADGDWNGSKLGMLGYKIDNEPTSPASSLQRIALDHRTAGARYTRFGVQIEEDETTPTDQVEARLSISVTPIRRGGGEVPVARATTYSDVSSDALLGPMFSTVDVDQISFVASMSGAGSAEVFSFKVQTTSNPEIGPWIDTAAAITLTEGGTEEDITSVDKTKLGTFGRVYVNSATNLTAGEVDVVATVRMR